MAKNSRRDGKKSSWHDQSTGKTCGACGGSGSKVDLSGGHVDACPVCRGFGKV